MKLTKIAFVVTSGINMPDILPAMFVFCKHTQSMHTHMHIHTCVCMFVYIYVYTYI